MINDNILDNFFFWVEENKDKIEQDCKPMDTGVICYIAIPVEIYNKLKDVSDKDNLDGLLNLFWDEWLDSCVKSHIVHCTYNEYSKNYEFIVDIDFTEQYITSQILNNPRGGLISDFY